MKKVLIALALVAASAAPALADYGKEPTMRRHQAAVSTYERHAEMRCAECQTSNGQTIPIGARAITILTPPSSTPASRVGRAGSAADVFCKQAKRAVPFEVRDGAIGPRQRYEDFLALYGHA